MRRSYTDDFAECSDEQLCCFCGAYDREHDYWLRTYRQHEQRSLSLRQNVCPWEQQRGNDFCTVDGSSRQRPISQTSAIVWNKPYRPCMRTNSPTTSCLKTSGDAYKQKPNSCNRHVYFSSERLSQQSTDSQCTSKYSRDCCEFDPKIVDQTQEMTSNSSSYYEPTAYASIKRGMVHSPQQSRRPDPESYPETSSISCWSYGGSVAANAASGEIDEMLDRLTYWAKRSTNSAGSYASSSSPPTRRSINKAPASNEPFQRTISLKPSKYGGTGSKAAKSMTPPVCDTTQFAKSPVRSNMQASKLPVRDTTHSTKSPINSNMKFGKLPTCDINDFAKSLIHDIEKFVKSPVRDTTQSTKSPVSDTETVVKSPFRDTTHSTRSSVHDNIKFSNPPIHDIKQYMKSPIRDIKQFAKLPVYDIQQYMKSPVHDSRQFTMSSIHGNMEYANSSIRDIKQYVKAPIRDIKQFAKSPGRDSTPSTKLPVPCNTKFAKSLVHDIKQYSKSAVQDKQSGMPLGSDSKQCLKSSMRDNKKFGTSLGSDTKQFAMLPGSHNKQFGMSPGGHNKQFGMSPVRDTEQTKSQRTRKSGSKSAAAAATTAAEASKKNHDKDLEQQLNYENLASQHNHPPQSSSPPSQRINSQYQSNAASSRFIPPQPTYRNTHSYDPYTRSLQTQSKKRRLNKRHRTCGTCIAGPKRRSDPVNRNRLRAGSCIHIPIDDNDNLDYYNYSYNYNEGNEYKKIGIKKDYKIDRYDYGCEIDNEVDRYEDGYEDESERALAEKLQGLTLTSTANTCCTSSAGGATAVVVPPATASAPRPRVVKPRDAMRRAALKRVHLYPPDGLSGSPLTLLKKWSNIDCHVTAEPDGGCRYKVYYMQKFESDKWFPDKKTGSPFRRVEDADCSTDYG